MNPSDQARQVGVVNSWLAQYRVVGYATNPTSGTIIGDTGAMAAGYYDVFYVMSSTVAMGLNQLLFVWRNAADNDYLWSDRFSSAGADSQRGSLLGVRVAANERFRGIVLADVTGFVTVGILAIRRA